MAHKGVVWTAVLLAVVLCGASTTPAAFGHIIDYVASEVQPLVDFSGQSGNFKLVNPVAPGAVISFKLGLGLIESPDGPTAALPVDVTFGVKNWGGPAEPRVAFGSDPNGPSTVTYTFDKTARSFLTDVRVTAPLVPGPYHVKIQALPGTNAKGLQPGEGIVIHFRVVQSVVDADTELSISILPDVLIYREPVTTVTAMLTSGGVGLPGRPISFSVDGADPYTAATGPDGTVTLTYDPSVLGVGDHTVAASYAGEPGAYKPDSGSAPFGIAYRWLGFQPPVVITGAGVGLFSGKVIPVKIKIADYYYAPVPDAEVRVYFSQTALNAETLATAIQPAIADAGNLMRYDALADQYILNWDISGVRNGGYNIRVAMAEGEKAPVPHWVPVQIQKSGRK